MHLIVVIISFQCRLRNLNHGPISDSKHELLEQPDQGYVVNNSKTTSNNKTPDQYLKKGEKARIFSIV